MRFSRFILSNSRIPCDTSELDGADARTSPVLGSNEETAQDTMTKAKTAGKRAENFRKRIG
jgi:hypothetical protein